MIRQFFTDTTYDSIGIVFSTMFMLL